MHATLVRAFTNPAGGLLADNQGSMQLLPGNRAFVGWGAQPYFNEFDADGSVLLNGHLPIGDQSYRAFTAEWTGHPTDSPAITVKANPARGAAAYVSWNGATEVASWQVRVPARRPALPFPGSPREPDLGEPRAPRQTGGEREALLDPGAPVAGAGTRTAPGSLHY